MIYKSDGHNWLVRLEKDELLVENLTKLIKQENIQGAWLNGLGAALWAELGFYDLDAQEYQWKKLEELLEITSLQGNVSWLDNEPALHIHGTFGNRDMRVLGGHVRELAVGGTCEVLLQVWQDGGLSRSKDGQTGLNLLTF